MNDLPAPTAWNPGYIPTKEEIVKAANDYRYTEANLGELPTHVLLSEIWPENIFLMKDSGSWGVWEDDNLDCLYHQEYDEGFTDFVKRVIVDMLNKEEPNDEGFSDMAVTLALAHANFSDESLYDVIKKL